MDFNAAKKIRLEEDHFAEKYPLHLNMYKDPPEKEITLNEFEELAIERLKVLRILEIVNLKGLAKNFDEWKEAVMKELRTQGLQRYLKLVIANDSKDYESRQIDHISHYILRFAYCQSEEYRRWFIAREFEFFKLRWSNLSNQEKQKFIEINNLNFTPLDESTCRSKSKLSNGLIQPCTVDYYCVQWTDVSELVRHRKVFLEEGKAYITATDLISVLGSVFRTNLSHSLVLMSHKLPMIREDERLKRLVNNLHHTYTGKSYTVNDSNKQVSLQSLDALSKTSFPLCMKQLHSALKTTHHLRHFGRQQFSLFLKGIGLSLEDALTFWRTEFTKKMDSDQFEKKYAYNIRHNYGKEGKRANYTPYSCAKIIASSVGPGEFHGCPFKHNDIQSLKQTFASLHITPSGSEEILNYINMGHYQLACAKYFEITHNTPILTGVSHPNQYFEESQKVLKGKPAPVTGNITPKAATTSSVPEKSVKQCLEDSVFEGLNLDELNGV